MSKPIRAFVAVPIPATPALRKVLRLLEMLGNAVKPVAADNLHVTLKFLGPMPTERIPDIVTVLHESTETETAFTARIVGLGAFPRAERPSVVWAGLKEVDSLTRIADRLEQRLVPLGFSHERRPFQPHLTLARVRRKPPTELADLLQNRQATEFGAAPVEAIQLFQSEPGPTGPLYRPLATTRLSSTVR